MFDDELEKVDAEIDALNSELAVTDSALSDQRQVVDELECKLRENECVYEKGLFCLGPVTRAGCEARCPSNGNRCEGCRGLVPDPNMNAQKDILEKYGLSVERVMDQFKLFQGFYEQVK